MKDCSFPVFDDGMNVWTRGIIDSPPNDDIAFRQKAWDTPHVRVALQSLLISADGGRARARIKADTMEESGAWLRVIPVLHLEDEVVCCY